MCLCAGWCGTCCDYRALFDALAQAHPEVRFEWVDIEDESELAGDLDVETFPTLLIADGRKAHFLGPLLPQAAVLERLDRILLFSVAQEGESSSCARIR